MIRDFNISMDSKPPQAAKPLRRKVHVVYYLSRHGQMDHPHLLEGYLTAAQEGLRLRDFKRWLAVLRGKGMPNSFAWSYKRNYKNGFIWHDLGDNDLIQPLCKNEYVLMGSEIRDIGIAGGNCKCGGVMERKLAEGEIQGETMSKLIKSPVFANNITGSILDQGGQGQTSRRFVAAEISDNSPVIKDLNLGGAGKSFELTAQQLLEEIKRPHNTNHSVLSRSNTRSMECEIIEEAEAAATANLQELHAAGRIIKANYPKQAQLVYKSRRNYGGNGDLISTYSPAINHSLDETNGVNMDAATQTGDSTRCSTDQEIITQLNINMLEVGSPGSSSRSNGYGGSRIKRVSSARLSHGADGISGRGNLSAQLSKEFPLSDVEKAIMINQSSEFGGSATTFNTIGSPALSSSSAISIKSTRFAREDHNQSDAAADANYKLNHHHNHRGRNLSSSHSSGPHVLLKQLLSCGGNVKSDHVIMSSNALSGQAQTPSRISTNPSSNAQNKCNNWSCRPGLNGMMKRISTSSDNKSVISGGVSDQGSMKDALELISSPESVYISRRNSKSMIRGSSLSSSVNLSANQLRGIGSTSPGMLSVCSSTSRRSSIRENDIGGGGDVEEGFREAFKGAVGASSKTRPSSKGSSNSMIINNANNVEEDKNNNSCSGQMVVSNRSIRSSSGMKPTEVGELHQIICNPCAPNMMVSSFTVAKQGATTHHDHTLKADYSPHHQHHHPHHRPSQLQLNLASSSMAKSLDSPASIFLERRGRSTSSSSSSWKDLLLWSPRYSSSHKEKDKRRMKP